MVFCVLQQLIWGSEWAFAWLQHNFVRVQIFVASLRRPFRRGRTVVSPNIPSMCYKQMER